MVNEDEVNVEVYVGVDVGKAQHHAWPLTYRVHGCSTGLYPTWAIDGTLPNPATAPATAQALPSDQQARVAGPLPAETAIAGKALVGIHTPDRTATLGQAETALAHAQQAGANLETGPVSGRPPRWAGQSTI